MSPRDPTLWPVRTLEYVDAEGRSLAAYPPGVAFTPDALVDPYTYDRAPGSGIYRAFGDGGRPDPPRLTLSGSHVYDTPEQAIAHVAALEAAHVTAYALHWRGQRLVLIRAGAPGAFAVPPGDRLIRVNFAVTLNTSTRLTWRELQEAQL